jgi:hypothetical protein
MPSLEEVPEATHLIHLQQNNQSTYQPEGITLIFFHYSFVRRPGAELPREPDPDAVTINKLPVAVDVFDATNAINPSIAYTFITNL